MFKTQVIASYLDQLNAAELPLSRAIVGYVQSNPTLERSLAMASLLKIEPFLIIMGFCLLFMTMNGNMLPFWRYLFALTIGFAAFKTLKVLVTRKRPWMLDESLTVESIRDTSPSFPSGHALMLSAACVVLLSYSLGFALILMPYVSLVLMNRVAYGLHFPSDLIVGIFIGLSLGSLAIIA